MQRVAERLASLGKPVALQLILGQAQHLQQLKRLGRVVRPRVGVPQRRSQPLAQLFHRPSYLACHRRKGARAVALQKRRRGGVLAHRRCVSTHLQTSAQPGGQVKDALQLLEQAAHIVELLYLVTVLRQLRIHVLARLRGRGDGGLWAVVRPAAELLRVLHTCSSLTRPPISSTLSFMRRIVSVAVINLE